MVCTTFAAFSIFHYYPRLSWRSVNQENFLFNLESKSTAHIDSILDNQEIFSGWWMKRSQSTDYLASILNGQPLSLQTLESLRILPEDQRQEALFYILIRCPQSIEVTDEQIYALLLSNADWNLRADFLKELRKMSNDRIWPETLHRLKKAAGLERTAQLLALFILQSEQHFQLGGISEFCSDASDAVGLEILKAIVSDRSMLNKALPMLIKPEECEKLLKALNLFPLGDTPKFSGIMEITESVNLVSVKEGVIALEHFVKNLPTSEEGLGNLRFLASIPEPQRGMALTFWSNRMGAIDVSRGVDLLDAAEKKFGIVLSKYSLIRASISSDPFTASALILKQPSGPFRDKLISALIQETNLQGEERKSWIDQLSEEKLRNEYGN